MPGIGTTSYPICREGKAFKSNQFELSNGFEGMGKSILLNNEEYLRDD